MFPLNSKQVVSYVGEMGFLIPKTFKKNSQHLQTEGKSLGSPLPALLYGIKFRVSAEVMF